MRFSAEPRFKKYGKAYGFLSFARKSGDKYGKELINTATKSASKRVVKKTAETTGDLIGNKIAEKTTSVGKSKEKKTKKAKETYIPPEKREQIINDLKLF